MQAANTRPTFWFFCHNNVRGIMRIIKELSQAQLKAIKLQAVEFAAYEGPLDAGCNGKLTPMQYLHRSASWTVVEALQACPTLDPGHLCRMWQIRRFTTSNAISDVTMLNQGV